MGGCYFRTLVIRFQARRCGVFILFENKGLLQTWSLALQYCERVIFAMLNWARTDYMRVVVCSTCTEHQIRGLESLALQCLANRVLKSYDIKLSNNTTNAQSFLLLQSSLLCSRSFRSSSYANAHRFHTTTSIALSLLNPTRCRTSRPVLLQSSAWGLQQVQVVRVRSQG